MFKRMNKVLMAVAVMTVIGGTSFLAQAEDETEKTSTHTDQGQGTVAFTGSIIKAACSIDPDSLNQTVDLGQISDMALVAGKTSAHRNFEIRLVNCVLADTGDKTITVTFTGAQGANNKLLGISGTAKGAGITLTDGGGRILTLGEPTEAHKLQNGNNRLLFGAYLQGDGSSSGITPGSFKSLANFTLAYQ